MSLLQSYEKNRPFTDEEAWTLFRLAAWGEALGWTLLIAGIALKQYALHGNNLPVLIAGQIHGTLFILYMVAAGLLYPSLGWRRFVALIAIAASVPPYGSLVFEQIMAIMRKRSSLDRQRSLWIYRRLARV